MVRNLEKRLERGRERADSFSLRRWIRVGSSLGRGRLIVMASLNAGLDVTKVMNIQMATGNGKFCFTEGVEGF